jgi:hypothetical protein
MTSPVQEYQKVMVFQAASLDSLLPVEIEMAERLIAHFLPVSCSPQKPEPTASIGPI